METIHHRRHRSTLAEEPFDRGWSLVSGVEPSSSADQVSADKQWNGALFRARLPSPFYLCQQLVLLTKKTKAPIM